VALRAYASEGVTVMSEAVGWTLFAFFVVLPLATLAVKGAWWAFRMVFWLCIIGISIAGAAWRGEIRT
jgi:hypothetical protein